MYLQYPFELNAVSYTRNWKIGASIFNVPQFHRTDSLAGEEGFEPSVHGIKIRCLTNLAIPQGAPRSWQNRGATGSARLEGHNRQNPLQLQSPAY